MEISIIGTSKITHHHINVLKKNFKIASISSTRKGSKNLKKIAKKFKIKKVFYNWKKSLDFSKTKKNSAFFITSRIEDNEKILLECCKLKKKIFIEKPVFIKSKKFNKFLKFNNQIFVGYNRLFYNNISFLKKKINKKKNLNIIVKCPEDNKKGILTNSCHVFSILTFLLGKLSIKKVVKNEKFINCWLNDRNNNSIYITFNFQSSDNFSIEIFQKKNKVFAFTN